MTLEDPGLHFGWVGCSCCITPESRKVVVVRHSGSDDVSGEGSSAWKSAESHGTLRFCRIDWPRRGGVCQAFEGNPLCEGLLIRKIGIRYILHHCPLAWSENIHRSFQDHQADNK